MQTYFITGTDTGIGKTTVACHLLHDAARKGQRTLGFKPIASGATYANGKLVNADALQLQQASSVGCDYDIINPICFEPPIAPHFAAQQRGEVLSVKRLLAHTETILNLSPELLFIEGAGGWLLPLNKQETMADYVKALQISVIVVVGMRLGCLNHALLTIAVIQQAGIPIAGWVANQLSPDMLVYEENLAWLKAKIAAPLLHEMPYSP